MLSTRENQMFASFPILPFVVVLPITVEKNTQDIVCHAKESDLDAMSRRDEILLHSNLIPRYGLEASTLLLTWPE